MVLPAVLTSPQSITTVVLVIAGSIMLLISVYQNRKPSIGIARIVSPRAKHLMGMLCLLFAFFVFLSQFVARQ